MKVSRLSSRILLGLFLATGVMATSKPADATFPGKNGKIVTTLVQWVSAGGESVPLPALYVTNPDGSQQQQIAASGYDPAYSPDGSKIAFARGGRGTETGLYVMNADGSNVTKIVSGIKINPHWSPDGTKIVFSTMSELHIINADGSGERKLTDYANGNQFDSEPSWSPDGKKIIFGRQPSSGWSKDLYVINTDGSGLKRLTKTDDLESYPDWSPDGSKIVLTRFRKSDASYSVYVMNPDGSNMKRLGAGKAPVWSPDGKKILFSGIFIMNPDGTNVTKIPISSSIKFNEGWQADWQRLP